MLEVFAEAVDADDVVTQGVGNGVAACRRRSSAQVDLVDEVTPPARDDSTMRRQLLGGDGGAGGVGASQQTPRVAAPGGRRGAAELEALRRLVGSRRGVASAAHEVAVAG